MAAKSTITQKIVPSISRPKRRWSKIRHNLRTNPHPKKSTTPCNRLHITKILIDNGSQAEILFLATFDKIGFE
jgi:hypothetical protein